MFYQTEQQEIAGNGRVSSGKKSKDITLSVLVCFCTCVCGRGFLMDQCASRVLPRI